jgi:hypothetical protein
VAEAAERFGRLAELGIELAIVTLPDLADPDGFARLAELVELLAPVRPAAPVRAAPAIPTPIPNGGLP